MAARNSAGCFCRKARRSTRATWTSGPSPKAPRFGSNFPIAGVRIETRLLEKRGPSDADWIPLAYVWDADGKDATAAPLGAIDAQHTDHDVPAAGECLACHGGRRSFILGLSALQLADSAAAGALDLDGLVQQGRLSHPPTSTPAIPGAPVEVAALGYLHANCSHCHNQTRPERNGARCFEPKDSYDFTLAVDKLDGSCRDAHLPHGSWARGEAR